MLLTRFAPTPSGYLHTGNAFSFILTWLLARLQGGKILLRIDDLDNERLRPAYLDDIFYSLDWLGLDYDFGPSGAADFYGQWSQHKRMDLYRAALTNLEPCLFACVCSRKQWQQASLDGQYPGTCIARQLPLASPDAVWRLLTPADAEICFRAAGCNTPRRERPADWMRHPVVRRKDGLPAYQLASVADDCHFGVNWVVRGQDLYASTVIQCYIAQKLGQVAFADITFYHHPLLKGADGKKLSKSAGSTALKTIAASSPSPAPIYEMLSAALLPQEPPARSASELLERTSISNILKINSFYP